MCTRSRISPGGNINAAEQFARDLRRLRQGCGKTYRGLAKETGLSFNTIAGYCTGRHLPQLSVAREFSRLLVALGVPVGPAHEAWIARLKELRTKTSRGRAPQTNPYPGLRSFQVDDVDLFFGRQEQTRDLVREVERRAGTAPLFVVGASGSGKTSLLRAGLIPAVDEVLLLTPGSTPLEEWIRRTTGSGHRALVVVDQFEELFTMCPDPDVRDAFIAAMLAWRGGVVAGLRADFYDRVVAHPALAALVQDNQFVVEPMTEPQLREVIVGPAQAAGFQLQEGFTDLVLRDVAREPGILPLLSHTLYSIVEEALRADPPSGTIRLDHYHDFGGVQGAVSSTAEAAFEELTATQATVARNLFLRLVNSDEGSAFTRRRVNLDEVIGDRLSAESDVVAEVLDVFISRRLLTADKETVEISHEALLAAWPRLQRWLAEDRAGHHLHSRLTTAARTWRADGKPRDGLYRGGRLEAALEWVVESAGGDALNSLEREFLAESEADEAARRSADRRRVRRRYQLITTVLVLVVVASGAGLYAQRVTSAASHEAQISLSQQTAAQAIRLRDKDPALAAQLALSAYKISPTAEARGALLDSSARPLPMRMRAASGDVGTVAVSESVVAIGTSAGTVQLFRTGGAGMPQVIGTELQLGAPVDALALSTDASTLAAGTRSGTVAAWRISDLERPVSLPLPRDGSARTFSVALSADGSRLAAGSGDRNVWLWDLSSGAAAAKLTGPSQAVKSVALTPDGRSLAAGGDDSDVHLWDVSTPSSPEAVATLREPASRVYSVAISPDGRTLAAGTASEHVVYTWDISDLRQPASHGAPLAGPESWVNTVAFSPDGRTVAAGSSDTSVWRWDLPTRQPLMPLPHPGPVNTVVFGDAGALITTSGDGLLRRWPLPGPLLIGSTNQVFSASFSADGSKALVGAGDRELRLWTVADSRRPVGEASILRNPDSLAQLAGASALSPDGRMSVGGATDGSLHFWDVTDPLQPVRLGEPLQVAGAIVQSIVFSTDGRTLAATSDDGSVHLVEVTDPGKPVILSKVAVAGVTTVYGARFSPDGRFLAAAAADSNGYLWNITDRANPQLLYTMTEPAGPVYATAFSADGTVLAFGGSDYAVRLIDLTKPSPTPIGSPLSGPVGEIYELAFHPDRNLLAVSSIDSTVWLWDLALVRQPKLVATLTAAEDGLFTTSFSPSGDVLVAGGRDSAVRLWLTDPDQAAHSLCAAVGTTITESEWRKFLSDEQPYSPPC
ncbi:helix-turn-helix domain-containing protein [Amycolatopsis magusensis]|uniref:nSTAND1 domain-containing NTPase n=1 Tax=Amycolatopsis magusensis TaxID=882444 RepID=UPI003C2EEDB2